MAFRYLTAALAVAGVTVAQSSCSVSGTTTISASAQASALSGCSTFSGSIAIATGTSDQIALDGITRIRGSLLANGAASLNSLSGDSLTTIDDTFQLRNCPALTSLTFPSLTNVANIRWVGLANLQGLTFGTGVQMAQTVLIDNTNLGSLDGINLQMVEAMALQNNPFLTSINMQLSNISSQFTVVANGRDVDLSLPNLITANNLIIQNVTTLNLASLSTVNGTFGFYSNFADSLSCPNLTTVRGTLAIDNNAQLTSASFPQLTRIGGALQVQNNTNFRQANGFQGVTTIGGAVSMYGVFNTVPLPNLDSVSGAFTILSSSNNQTLLSQCNRYEGIHGPNNVIRGSGFDCNNNVDGAATKGGSPTSSGSPSGSASATSTGAANTLLISGTTGVLGVVAAMFGML